MRLECGQCCDDPLNLHGSLSTLRHAANLGEAGDAGGPNDFSLNPYMANLQPAHVYDANGCYYEQHMVDCGDGQCSVMDLVCPAPVVAALAPDYVAAPVYASPAVTLPPKLAPSPTVSTAPATTTPAPTVPVPKVATGSDSAIALAPVSEAEGYDHSGPIVGGAASTVTTGMSIGRIALLVGGLFLASR